MEEGVVLQNMSPLFKLHIFFTLTLLIEKENYSFYKLIVDICVLISFTALF